MALSSQRTLYPVGSAYRSETGGLMEALRKLTVEQSSCLVFSPFRTGISPRIQFANTTAHIMSLTICLSLLQGNFHVERNPSFR